MELEATSFEEPPGLEVQPSRRIWPLLVVCVGTGLANLGLLPLTAWIEYLRLLPLQTALMMFVFGIVSGQACLVVLFAGLLSRNWLLGFSFATLVGMLCLACLLGGQMFWLSAFIGGIEPSSLWAVLCVPLGLIASAVPCFVLRYFWGMHLTRCVRDSPRSARNVEDIFLTMVVVGAALFLARVPQVAWESRVGQYWLAVASVASFIVILSLCIVLPCALIAFSKRRLRVRLLLQAAFTVGAFYVASALAGGVFQPQVSEWWLVGLSFGVVPCAIFFVGTAVLRQYGFRLARFAPAIEPNSGAKLDLDTGKSRSQMAEGPFGDSNGEAVPSSTSANGKRWEMRFATACILLLAVGGSIATAFVESSRKAADKQLLTLGTQLSEGGTELAFRERKAWRLQLGPEASEEDLAKLDLPYLQILDLSGSKVTDGIIELLPRYSKLRHLDLSDTAITARTLNAVLDELPNLQRLSLAGTNLKPAEVADAIQSMLGVLRADGYARVRSLDLSRMPGWGFEDLKRLQLYKVQELGLGGYGLDDKQVQELLCDPDGELSVFAMDLSDNNLNGSFAECLGFPSLNEISIRLTLDGNPIDDVYFAKALFKARGNATPGGIQLNKLSLGDTELTDNIMVSLGGFSVAELVLGAGKISEKAVNLKSIPKVRLNALQFTGVDLLRNLIGTNIQLLDLSYSGANKETAKQLASMFVTSLDLSHTQIGDESLPFLINAGVSINLSHTKVTADGLISSPLSNWEQVIVAFGQFTDEEVSRISKVINLDVGGISPLD